ncbi:hypothetical protein KCU99_g2356, partial [Aureobasidium melanogenum]
MQLKSLLSSLVLLYAAGSSKAQELSYEDSIHALAYGNVALQGNSSGTIWLNITGFAPQQLPTIQTNLGLFTYDNLEALNAVTGLARIAASKGQYGDLVFLYNVFSMNAFADYAHVASEQMQAGLLAAVTGKNSTVADPHLVELYANTSSSAFLREAYQNLPKTSAIEKRWAREACDSAHQAVKSACRTLINSISVDATWKSGGPRSICRSGCCISWSANATFQIQNLTNAANYCVQTCGGAKVSCEVWGVSLQGYSVDQCLSNRADGCT